MEFKRLKRAEKGILQFSANTRKAPARLQTEVEIQSRLDLLEEKWVEFKAAYAASDDADAEEDNEEDDAVEQAYLAALNELKVMLHVFSAQRVIAQPINAAPVQQQGIRMKAIDVPIFSGDIEDWVSFRDLFRSIVGNNDTLSAVQRLQHLRMACKGKSAELIRHLELTDGNYEVAWTALVKRYEDRRWLLTRLIKRLLDLPPMTRECPDQLSVLLDGTNQVVNSLRVLNEPVDQWASVLVVLTVRKLDSTTLMLWERSIASTVDMPSFNLLDTFLAGTLKSFEAVKSAKQNDCRVVRTHVVTSRTFECVMCHNAHMLHNCPMLLEKSIQARRSFVEQHRLCFNCLRSGHTVQSCNSRFRCSVCSDRHHTMLHVDGNSGARVNPFRMQPQQSHQQQCGSSSVAAQVSTSSAGAQTLGSSAVAAAAPPSTLTVGVQLHQQQQETAAAAQSSISTNVCQSTVATGVLLPTAWVTVTASNGRRMNVRALIDQASEATLITERVVQSLAATKTAISTNVIGVGGTSAGTTANCVKITMTSCVGGEEREKGVNTTALVMKKITENSPSQTIARSGWNHLERLQLADPHFDVPGEIELLIGANAFADILLDGVRHGGREDVVAQRTIFGWIVTGRAMAVPSARVVTMHVRLENMLQRFWEQEELDAKPMLSKDDVTCEAMYTQSTTRDDDGRYVVHLPFRQGGRDLGESQFNAARRLQQMEKKGGQYPHMYEGYREFMRTYLKLGHMELIPSHQIDTRPHCYLPHHAVFKPDSTTTKIRVVFDATAATTNGRGLNALLLTGPRLQETLASILMRWRTHKYVISADVEKMYRQIWVAADHQDYQRILWRESADEPMMHYRLKTVTYGTASAPYLAVKTMLRLADDEVDRFPLAAEVVRNDFYVDDCLSGAETLDGAIALKDELLGLMKAGGMRLMKWSSNSAELLRTLDDDHIECRAPLSFDDEDGIKALGIRWFPASDDLRYKVRVFEMKSKMTKREMLSEIAKLFDPLGLLSPVIVLAKIQIQQLWLTGLQWDDELPNDVRDFWRRFQHQLPTLEEIRIPRWCHSFASTHIELHGFSDASMHAYSACVYTCVYNADGSITTSLMAAKTKVAPIKQQCIPRLELNGALLLAGLLREVTRAMKCDNAAVFAWTDSMTVLAWLRKHSNVWPTYVANRVSKIHTTMEASQWRHVPGVDNPADVASRGCMPADIKKHPLWWTGPTWLSGGRESWPAQTLEIPDPELLENKKEVKCLVVKSNDLWALAHKYSSWSELLRITAYMRRMLRQNRRDGCHLHADEIEEARVCWLRLVQQNEFGDVSEMLGDTGVIRQHRLQKLFPFVDGCGLLRVGGRLQNAALPYDERHPVIVPSQNPIAKLIVLHAHEKVFHAGPQNTMGWLHQQYWLLNERRRVRQIVHNCVTCTRARPTFLQQLMGNLPLARVQISRAFTHTAIDYGGPFWSHTARGRGRRAHKSYIAVFICLSTKAVHLELVSELTSVAFIAAYHRFTARRGACSDIYCDNGTNFVGADRELQAHLRTAMQNNHWRAELSGNGTRFHFAPPGSPHFNGLAESTVKMAKSAIAKVIGDSKLTFEEMATFLAQVEAALNSRPLCAIPAAGDETTVLTPGHMLIGQPLTAIPEPSIVDTTPPSNRWKLLQHMAQHFWRRWSREYMHQLQQRQKWTQPMENIKIGDVVVVADDVPYSTRWRTGRVVDLHPGKKDGLVRVATVKTAQGVITRTITKLALLPVNTFE